MKFIQKILKYLVFLIVILIISINLLIILSGRFYLYKGVANTYLIGRTGPSIYDKEVFAYSTIKKSDSSNVIPKLDDFNKYKLSKEDLKFIEDLETKAFLVFKGDSLLYEKYWDKHTENTVSNSFSVAKTLVALLIGIAVEEGKIKSLDESVSNYIPEFKEGGREIITIRHLLAMSSGLDWKESGKDPFSDNAESYYGSDLYGHVTRQRLVQQPGEYFKYQSGNSQLLGFVVENATGVSLSEYAEEKIWKPIGAEHEIYWNLDKEGGDEKAFCCLYATAHDYARLGQLILNQGKHGDQQIFPLWFYHEMIASSALDTEDGVKNSRYGLHIWTYNDEHGQVNYCRGIKGQFIITIPSSDLLIVRLGTKRSDKFELDHDKANDKEYVQKVKKKVGHGYDLFRYVEIGKNLIQRVK